MSRSKGPQKAAIAGICLCFFALYHTGNTSAQTADEGALRALVNAFYAAQAEKNLEQFSNLWNAKSPEAAARKAAIEKLFAGAAKIEVGGVTVNRITVDGDRARARLTVDMQAVDARTGRPMAESGRLNRLMEFAREAGGWKVWGERSVEEDLARQVVAAATDVARRELLQADRDVDAKLLTQSLRSQTERLIIQGAYEQAMEVLALTLGVAEQAGDPTSIAMTLAYIGRVQHVQARSDLALASFQKGLALSEAAGNKLIASRALSNIGNVYMELGNYRLSLEYFQKSLGLIAELKDDAENALRFSGIGSLYYLQGNYDLAMQFYEKALAVRQAAGNKFQIAGDLHNMGLVHSAQGRYEEAISYFRRTLAIGEELGAKPGIALTEFNIGTVYLQKGDQPAALEHFGKALELSGSMGDKPGMAKALIGLAKTHLAQRDFGESLKYAERATELLRPIGRPEFLWEARAAAGRAYRALSQPQPARAAFEEAIETIESIRAQAAGGEQEKERFFEGRISPYYAMVELLLADNKPREALAYAERAKGRVLLDVLRGDGNQITKAMTAAEQEQERQLVSRLVSLNMQLSAANAAPQPKPAALAELKARLQKARLEYEAFQAGLYAAHPKLQVQRGLFRPFGLEQAADLLADDRGALLEYVVTDEKSYLFVLTRTPLRAGGSEPTLAVYEVNITRKDLAERAARFRQRLANRDRDFAEQARDLYRRLVEPARAQLQGKTWLAVVPDSALWELPFQALQSAADRYLIEDYAISYAPSISVLREMMKERRRPDGPATAPLDLLALGNPDLSQKTTERARLVPSDAVLGPLPEAERQVKMLGQLYGAGRSRVLVGAGAREELLKAEAGKYHVLHLATHGILNDAAPMYSHLLLSTTATPGNEDGLLEAWEVMKLDLKARLVVLTACETARGRIGAGEGVIGLSWALFVAGCPTTVVSQWQVESASTTDLMLAFHRNLQPARVSEAEALRQAALQLLRSKSYRHPFFWAPFVVMGDGFSRGAERLQR